MDPSDTFLPALLLLALGGALVALGLGARARRARRLSGGVRVRGVVVDETRGQGHGSWVPVVRFTAPDGHEVVGRPRTSGWHGVSRVGREVDLVCDPADPRRFDLVRDGGGPATVLLVAGAVPIVLAVLALLP